MLQLVLFQPALQVYASDPWYATADAVISDFELHVGETPALHRNAGYVRQDLGCCYSWIWILDTT